MAVLEPDLTSVSLSPGLAMRTSPLGSVLPSPQHPPVYTQSSISLDAYPVSVGLRARAIMWVSPLTASLSFQTLCIKSFLLRIRLNLLVMALYRTSSINARNEILPTVAMPSVC